MGLLNNENEIVLQHRNQSQKAIHPFDSNYLNGDKMRFNMCTVMRKSTNVGKTFKSKSQKPIKSGKVKKKSNRPMFLNHNQLKLAWQEGSMASISNPKISEIIDKQSGSINFDTRIDMAKNKIESCTKLPNLEDVSTRNTFIKDRFSKRQSCKDYCTNQYAEDQFYKSQTPVFSGNLNREISLENKTQNDQKVLTICSSSCILPLKISNKGSESEYNKVTPNIQTAGSQESNAPPKFHKAQTAHLHNYESRREFVKKSIKSKRKRRNFLLGEKTQHKNINIITNCNSVAKKLKKSVLKFNENIHWYCNCKDHRPKEPQIKKLNILKKGRKTAPRLNLNEEVAAEFKTELTPKINQFFVDYGNKFLYE